ncbi:MAG: hypothetical protein NT167_11560, partial [Verrucomicrobia bacterium]|nr:hypothetical protein [Verrucomicrobiota bacterium]
MTAAAFIVLWSDHVTFVKFSYSLTEREPKSVCADRIEHKGIKVFFAADWKSAGSVIHEDVQSGLAVDRLRLSADSNWLLLAVATRESLLRVLDEVVEEQSQPSWITVNSLGLLDQVFARW